MRTQLSEQSLATEAENNKVNILLVDDRPDNLQVLEAILDSPSYNLIKAESGTEALKQVLVRDFAVILLDVQMPGLDGFETAALIRKRKKSRHIPILLVTAINKEERYVAKGYSVGAVDYIFKPFDPEVLRAKVAVFVDLFRKSRQIKRQSELLRQSEQRERERKLAELRHESEQRYRNLADSIPQIVWTANSAGRIDYVNRRGIEYLGAAESPSAPGRMMRRALHPDDANWLIELWRKARYSGQGFSVEARLRRASDRTFRWHLIHVLAEKDGENRLLAWLGTATDIDDQKRIAQALATEKERLAVTLRSIGDGVITTDIDGRVVLMNGAAERLTGWSQDEARGKLLAEVFHVQDDATRLRCEDPADEVLRTGTALELDRRTVLIARDGTARLIADSSTPIRDVQDELLGVVLVFRDITDSQRLEEERQKASKLESVGVLAGAIAHDFNNILTAVMGNISLAKLYSEQNREVVSRLGDAENAIIWAKDLTQQLLTFSKGGSPVRKICAAFHQLVHDAADFASRGSSVRCEFEAGDPLWAVDIDEGQIRQVIHNLVLNAQQAMPDGGKIKIAVKNVVLGRGNKTTLPSGRYVKISCEDRGVGIAPEHLPKIFDPYFTTKQKGSGLGLATTYSILKKHEGLITVESVLGEGTHFDIYLPASNSMPEMQRILPTPPSKGHGKILVMDDEPRIRDMLARMLSHFGYEVASVPDGADAIRAYEEAHARNAPFDVVIMDLVVPGGMGGREAIKKLLEIDASACVIVSSGYSNDPIMADFSEYGFRDAVAKPYRHEELRNVIHRIMAEKSRAA